MTNTEIILGLSGPLTALVWGASTLFVREKSRNAAKEEFAAMIKGALAEFEISLVTRLNGLYRRTNECLLTMGPIQEKVATVEDHLRNLEAYAHKSKHDFDSKLFGIQACLLADKRASAELNAGIERMMPDNRE